MTNESDIAEFRERLLDLVEEMANAQPQEQQAVFLVNLMVQAAIISLAAVKTLVRESAHERVLGRIQSAVGDLTLALRPTNRNLN